MTETIYSPVTPKIMADSLNLMREGSSSAEALFIKFNYLPTLYNQFKHLVIGVSTSSQVLCDTTLTTKMELEKSLKELGYIEDELKGTHVDRAETDILSARATLSAKVKVKVQAFTDLLSRQLSSLKSPLESSLTQGYLKESEKDQAKAEAALTLLNENKGQLQEQRKTITTAIDVLSQGGIEAIGKEVALTLENVTNLGLTPPEVQVIMLAIEQMKKTIGKMDEGIRFLDMVQQRDALVAKITNQTQSIALSNKQITSFKGQIEFINTLHAIDSQLKIYVDEYQRTVDTFQLFTTQIDIDYKAHTQQFIQFLNPLSKPW